MEQLHAAGPLQRIRRRPDAGVRPVELARHIAQDIIAPGANGAAADALARHTLLGRARID